MRIFISVGTMVESRIPRSPTHQHKEPYSFLATCLRPSPRPPRPRPPPRPSLPPPDPPRPPLSPDFLLPRRPSSSSSSSLSSALFRAVAYTTFIPRPNRSKPLNATAFSSPASATNSTCANPLKCCVSLSLPMRISVISPHASKTFRNTSSVTSQFRLQTNAIFWPSVFLTSSSNTGLVLVASPSPPAPPSRSFGAYFFTTRNFPSHSSPFHARAFLADSRVTNVNTAIPRNRPESGNVKHSMVSTSMSSVSNATRISCSVL
mmetsp:Transcript_991/g.3232  ORF Transcript_991/g.3232 Transcript_991/m.3232 type:complete len:262 (-) Transcript_991:934-1719(-)